VANFQLNVSLEGAEKLSAMAAILTPKLFDRALAGGVKYSARSVPPAVAKAATAPGRYNIRAAAVKDDVKRPSFGDGGRTAVIRISRRPRTAAQFGGRQTRRGYSFAVVRGERQVFTRGFIGKGKLQGLPLYRVKAGSESRANGGRSRLEVIHGVSTGSMFLGDSRFGEAMKREVEQRMSDQFLKGVDRELSRAARGF